MYRAQYSFLAKDYHCQLSPAYDLTPTPTIAQDRLFLAMVCGVHGRLVCKENLLSAHERFLLSKQEAENIVDSIVTIVKNQWHAALRGAGASEKDCAAIASAFVYEGFN